LPTHQQTPEESAALVLAQLEAGGYIAPAAETEVYSEAEQAELEKRLAELGYL